MRFTAFVGLAACRSLAMRPEISRAAVSKRIATIGDLVPQLSSASGSLAALKAASVEVSSILAEAGGPDDHISDDDAALLRQVIDLVDKTIYSSMDASHNADVAALAAAVDAAAACNADITQRQAPEGDLGVLHQHVQDKQTELDRLQGVVDEKTEANNTKWEEFDSHMQMIAAAPACPDFPARTMPALDVYFEKSEYSIWFAAQQASYDAMRDGFTAADSALTDAIRAYNIQKAIRDVQYCDWKGELEAACAAFDKCFTDATIFFNEVLVPRVEKDMASRIEVKKAGDTLIHQINFLLGSVETQQTPAIDVSRYTIAFPSLPAKGLCDLSPLDADEWVPVVTCSSHRLVDGCARNGNLYPAWGLPRTAMDDERVGEAVCCSEKGVATRNIRRHVGLFDQGLSHVDCTTTKTTQLKNGGKDGDSPSHTFFEAHAICTNAGLRLCRTQEEMDTSCNTGCHINFALAWLDDEVAAYQPTSTGAAWLNHFESFGAQDVERIMLDYDDESVLAVFNDACANDTGYAEYQGTEIKGFFESLFTTLGPQPGLVVPEFAEGEANPLVEPETGALDATANVFLVWSSPAEGIEKATDSFLWKDDYKIMKQNIVVTEPAACQNMAATPRQVKPVPDAQDNKIVAGWENHFAAFGEQNVAKIMLDYLDTSIIRIFDYNGDLYSKHEGLAAIEAMFTGLFAAINAGAVGGNTGVDVRYLDVQPEYKSVFLVWTSFSHPQATDTFLFDDEGKIVRQNIVATSESPYQPTSAGAAWLNHFESFGAQDVERIMLDYDDESVLAVFNDACANDTGYAEYQGTEIKGFFESLFTTLGPQPGLVVPEFAEGEANPLVEPETGALDATANVFLVWSSPAEGIEKATDSFLWKDDYKIMKQNIVVTEPAACQNMAATPRQVKPVPDAQDNKIVAGWENHFAAFGEQNVAKIMLDYLDTSIIRIFDYNGDLYSKHEGLAAIEAMFTGLFAAINAGAVGGNTGVDVRYLDVQPEYKSVFLVWTSFSHPQATDTFLFDDEGKIVRQNIVATSESPFAYSTLFVPSFSVYPGYPGGLAVQGQMTIHSEGTGADAAQTLTWSLTGLDKACFVGAADDVKNGCGIHIHSGTSCDDAATVGGHYYSDSLGADPWSPVVYTSTDGLSTEHAGVRVITGLSSAEINGRVMVVHKLRSGTRIACGVIGTQTGTGDSLEVVDFKRYPGYDGPLQVSGTMKVRTESGTETSASQVLSWNLAGLDTACQAGAAEGISNGCGIHVHSGTSCESAADVGGHFFSGALEADPWKPVVYVASPDGSAAEVGKVATGLSSADITGRVMVVHELNSGARIACGVIQGPHKPTPSTLVVPSFSKYPGYTGDLVVEGQMTVHSEGEGPDAAQTLTWSLTGLDTACSPGAADDVKNGCGIHIHSGKSCEDAATVGGHYYSDALAADPWSPVVYTSTDGLSTEQAGISVITGLSSAQIDGRVMVVHQLGSGARIACGVIGTQP